MFSTPNTVDITLVPLQEISNNESHKRKNLNLDAFDFGKRRDDVNLENLTFNSDIFFQISSPSDMREYTLID